MATATIRVRLSAPGHGLTANDMMTAAGLHSFDADLNATVNALGALCQANTPAGHDHPSLTDAVRANQVRSLLAHVAALRAFHEGHIDWVKSVLDEDEDQDDDIDEDEDEDDKVAEQMASGLIQKLALMDVAAEYMAATLKAYDRSQRVWWATALVATALAEPIVGWPAATAVGLQLGWVVRGMVQLWRDPARWFWSR